jgi:hypothetical protein
MAFLCGCASPSGKSEDGLSEEKGRNFDFVRVSEMRRDEDADNEEDKLDAARFDAAATRVSDDNTGVAGITATEPLETDADATDRLRMDLDEAEEGKGR